MSKKKKGEVNPGISGSTLQSLKQEVTPGGDNVTIIVVDLPVIIGTGDEQASARHGATGLARVYALEEHAKKFGTIIWDTVHEVVSHHTTELQYSILTTTDRSPR